MRKIAITVPIILNLLCLYIWLIVDKGTGIPSYIQILVTIFSPIYMLCVCCKDIGTFHKLDIKTFFVIYIVTRIALIICNINFNIFTVRSDLTPNIRNFIWLVNTTFFIVGWIIIKAIKTLYYHIKK